MDQNKQRIAIVEACEGKKCRYVEGLRREGLAKSEALKLLIRTLDAEKIEPTLPVDYSKVIHPQRGYAITQILDS
jgi:hypothetical protein